MLGSALDAAESLNVCAAAIRLTLAFWVERRTWRLVLSQTRGRLRRPSTTFSPFLSSTSN